MCLGPSDIKNGLMGTVDCAGVPQLFPMEWIGYDNTGAAPCGNGAADCEPEVPLVDAGPHRTTCPAVPVSLGGDPTVLGGTPPHTFSWTPTTGLDDPSVANPIATLVTPGDFTYTVLVTDADQNTDADSTTVTVHANPLASVVPVDTLICLGASVPLTAQGSGGAPPYSFQWTPVEGLTDPNIATPTATPTSSTIYTVTVTDQNGCQGMASVTITVSDDLAADAGADFEIDEGDSISIGGSPTASGGTAPYSYSWTPTEGLDDPTAANPIAAPSDTTTYVVVVTDALACTAADSMACNVRAALAANAGPEAGLCVDGSVTIGGSPTATGGTPPYTYSWTPTAGLDDPTAANPTASPSTSTIYTVVVMDAESDEATDSVHVTIGEVLTAEAGPNVEVDFGQPATIGGNPTASCGTSPYTYQWTPTVGLDDATAANPQALPMLGVSETTTYTVEITDATGETDTDAMTVTVQWVGIQAALRIDDGWFLVTGAPPAWVDAGPTTDGLLNHLIATERRPGGLGGEDGALLHVTSLRAGRWPNLVGQSFCAVVHTISSGHDPPEGDVPDRSLAALRLAAVGVGFDPPGSTLPSITMAIVNIDCDGDGATPAAVTPPPPSQEEVALYRPHPNPFRESTRLVYSVPDGGHVRIGVYNAAGRRVRQLVSGASAAGSHTITWDGRNDSGAAVSPGIYFCRLAVGDERRTVRVTRVR